MERGCNIAMATAPAAEDNRQRREQLNIRLSADEMIRVDAALAVLAECTQREAVFNALEFAARHVDAYRKER